MRKVRGFVIVLLLAAVGEARADWLSLRSEHFQVIGNASRGQLSTVALRLEQFRDVVSQLNPDLLRADTAAPVVVLVFRDRRSYEPFMPRAEGRVVRVDGTFTGGDDINYITLTTERAAAAYPIIFHEYAHLLTRNVFADAPLWFNEGLAEYYSTFDVIGNGRRANVGKAIPNHVALLRERRLPLARFFSVDRNSPLYTSDTIERHVLYAQAWAIVHHAFHGPPERREQLLRFVSRLAAGGATEASFREVYRIELRDLENEIQTYVLNNVYRYAAIELEDSIVNRIDPEVTALSDVDAEARLGDLLAHMGRTAEAQERLERVLAAKPDVGLAHARLGRIKIAGGRSAEGMAHLRRAVELGTDSAVAHYAYGYELVRQERAPRSAIEEAARAFSRAIAIRPAFTEAKLLLAYTQLALEQYAEVRDLLTPVVRAEPSNNRASLRLGEALLRLNDLDGARALIGPVLSRATDDRDRTQARSLLALVAGLQLRRDTLASSGLPVSGDIPPTAGSAPGTTPAGSRGFVPALRQVVQGEERVYGVLHAIECGVDGVVLVARTATGDMRAWAEALADIDFISFRRLESTQVRCGPVQPPREVYLTRRPDDSGTSGMPVAVAVEVLPEGFVP